MVGAVGRVSHVNEDNPEKLYIEFIDETIYGWFFRGKPLPSAWMEHNEPAQLNSNQKLIDVVTKITKKFFKTVDRGDLQTIKLLHYHHRIDIGGARNANGMTALQLACEKGYKEVINWLIEEAKVGIDVIGTRDFRAIHYAVRR